MRQARRRAYGSLDSMRCLLGELLPLDDHLDVVLVLSPRIVVAPPHWSLIFADEAEMLACCAHGSTLITLLSS